MIQNAEKVLRQVRPALQADGGNVGLANVNNGVVRFCPRSMMTPKNGHRAVINTKGAAC